MSPFKTPFQEIEAYSRIMRVYIEPWEARVIRDLGGAYLRYESLKARQPKGMKNVIPMTDSERLKELFRNQGQSKPPGKGKPNGSGRTGPGGQK